MEGFEIDRRHGLIRIWVATDAARHDGAQLPGLLSKAGSFTAAAMRLGLSRSAAAKAVARLEGRLGTRLITRTTRRLALTDDGRRFHARCAALIADLDAAEAEVAQRGTAPRGTLRLAAPDGYDRLCLLPVVARYLEAHPGVRVELTLSDRAVDMVESGLDLAVWIGAADALPPDLVARVVGRLRHGFYAAPAYLAARGRPEALADLSAHDGLPYNTAAHGWRWRALSDTGVWQELGGGARISADSADAVLRAAVLDLGVAYLPEFLAAEAVEAGQLEAILAGEAGAGLPIVAVYPTRRNLPPKVRAFLDLLGGDPAGG